VVVEFVNGQLFMEMALAQLSFAGTLPFGACVAVEPSLVLFFGTLGGRSLCPVSGEIALLPCPATDQVAVLETAATLWIGNVVELAAGAVATDEAAPGAIRVPNASNAVSARTRATL
jgi:hypothetical protein